MVKRYKQLCWDEKTQQEYVMGERSDGDWVRYKDYEKLEQKYITNRLKNIVIRIGTFDKNETGCFIKFNDRLKDIIEYFNKQNKITPEIE